MKSKLKGVMGIGFALVLVASLMLFAIPTAAGPYDDLEAVPPNMWVAETPTPGVAGNWFFDPSITQVGPLAQAINGDLYAYVAGTAATPNNPGTDDIFKSTDNGRTWSASSIPFYYFNTNIIPPGPGGPVVDMVCSSKSEDVIYLTDGNYVWKSINGGASFALVAPADLEKQLMGACGTQIQGGPITCIDVGYDGAGKPIVLIGTKHISGHIYPVGHPKAGQAIVGSIYYIADETFSASWTDLDLSCYTCCTPSSGVGCYDVYAVAAAPGFENSSKVYGVITAPLTRIDFAGATATVEIKAGAYGASFDYSALAGVTPAGPATVNLAPHGVFTLTATAATGPVNITVNDGTLSWRVATLTPTVPPGVVTFCGGTHVVSTLGHLCEWTHVSEVKWDCKWSFEIQHASRIMFPSYYATTPTLFVGVAAVDDWDITPPNTIIGWGEGGDVYRVSDTIPVPGDCVDLNVQGFRTGCEGLYHANICSLDIDENDAMAAGAWDRYLMQSPTRVYYSADGGWTWAPSKKDPTGTDRAYVLFGGSIVAGTRGCDCAFSLSCGANLGDFFDQISLISMQINEVLDMTHAPGYVLDSQIMYVLTAGHGNATQCCCDAVKLAATADDTEVTMTVTGALEVALLPDSDTDGDATVTKVGNIFTLKLPDIGDAVMLTAIGNNVTVTLAITGGVGATVVSDCDGDIVISGNTITMPDGYMIHSLLRWDGTYWERVHSSRYFLVTPYEVTLYNSPLYDWVEVSPDFNSTDCLYMANTGFYMTRSINAGCSWDQLVYPCLDRPDISAWIVVDEDTVLAAGAGDSAGNVWRTTNHGAQPWSKFRVSNSLGKPACCGVDFDLSIPRAADSDVLLGDACGQVYLSKDLGETWSEIQDVKTSAFAGATDQTYVVFDPGYGTAGDPGENTFYAAAGNDIGRCAYNADALPFKQDWLYLSTAAGDCEACSLCLASGIDASGDTCLYVADAGVGGDVVGSSISGTIAVRYSCGDQGSYTDLCTCDVELSLEALIPISGTFQNGEPVTIAEYDLYCTAAGGIAGDITIKGLISGAYGKVIISETLATTCSLCGPTSSAFEVISSNLTATVPTGGLTSCSTGVWRTLNPLDVISESTGLNLVEFEFLSTGLMADSVLRHPAATDSVTSPTFTIYPDDLWLTAGSNVLWALDGVHYTYIWMWGDPLAAPVIQISPADGALLATSTTATVEWEKLDGATLYEVKVYAECPECLNPLEMKDFTTETTTATCITITDLLPGTKYFWKVRVACDSPQVSKWSDLRSFDTALSATIFCSPECGAEDITLTPNFSWSAVIGATGYEIEVSLTEDFATVLASGTPSINAWDGIPELDYATTYYWRVRAVKDGVYSGWTYCLFSTLEAPPPPEEKVEPVEVTIEEITPTWIWVIIGIGGALTIAVIILIVTTRRVP
jgi:hypothetical protein